MRTLIRNGRVVTAVDSYVADILIDGATISMIGADLAAVVGSVAGEFNDEAGSSF